MDVEYLLLKFDPPRETGPQLVEVPGQFQEVYEWYVELLPPVKDVLQRLRTYRQGPHLNPRLHQDDEKRGVFEGGVQRSGSVYGK